jgi:osmotically-inducible protein OsmY
MNRYLKMRRDGLSEENAGSMKRHAVGARADTELAAAATNAIDCLTTVPLDRIKVSAQQGWLYLEGTVNWDHQRITLEEVTRPLAGVRGVTNSVMIQSFHACPD